MAVTLGLLSTFPPTQCGLATFCKALADQLLVAGASVSVVRVVDATQRAIPMVAHQLVNGQPGAAPAAAAALNACDAVIVQHEYGIYGGPDGAEVLDVLRRVTVPVVTVLHTVLADPTPHQHQVLRSVLQASDLAVTMTEAGRRLVIAGWGADPAKVTVIPHGAHPNESAVGAATESGPDSARPTVLTWGLLGAGKGIEWALQAFAELTDLDPLPRYRVVGQTHPKVREHEGEAYRERLVALTERLGIASMVEFDDRYLDLASLNRIVRTADIVLLPYDSRDQVTSGVLTEAVVAGKPVVSTPFPHAVELLSDGPGLLVPRRDPRAIAAALRRLLTDPELAGQLADRAEQLAPALLWSAIARQYLGVATALGRRSRSVA